MNDRPIDLKDEIKEAFMSSPSLNYRDVADEFGISYETVRGWGKSEGWILERNKNFLADIPDDIMEQVEEIRKIVYLHIIGDDITTSELVDLVKSWKMVSDLVKVDKDGFDRDSLLSGIE